ncbi:MAG TPA: LuxR C-terminal-related transcriptional regulator [Streptosporangiaceae bacterium]|nr:LuxR C-terminal-related transcriptional regulator [Streptosporangiaceae bacterium]
MVPPLPPRHIWRPRLITALDGADVPLALLAAGPGAGKTVLLSEWVLRRDEPVAWMTMTAGDVTPQRFWHLLWSALRACGTQHDDVSPVTAGMDSIERVQALLARLPEAGVPPVLVIDDAHLLTNRDVLTDLDEIMRSGAPPRLRLVLAARSDPLLPLHRYRLAGQLVELRAEDLALTRGELEALLATHSVFLSAGDVDTLLTRTEGWVAGARLCAMRMENAEYPARFVSELALGEGSIGEYLVAEVLEGQPEPVRRLLTETSLFDEVTGPMADAVTGLEGCADMLARLAASNSFVIPVDAARTRFRYHQLLGEILRHELQWRERGMAPGLMRRAAAYFEGTGDFRRALYWAARAGDWTEAAAMLARGGLAHAFVNHDDISGLGFDVWPSSRRDDASAAQAPGLAIASSAVAAVRADTGAAARQLGTLSVSAAERPTDPDLLLVRDLVQMILGMKAGDTDAVADAAGQLIARTGQSPRCQVPGLNAAVLLAQACTLFWHGRTDDADALLATALAEAEGSGPPAVTLEVLAMTAFVDSIRSRPRHAEDAAYRAHVMLQKDGELSSPPALELAAATRLLIAADAPGAALALERAHVPDAVGTDPALATAREIGWATTLLASGDIGRARAIAQRSPRVNLPVLTALRETLLADTETLLGRPHAALELLRDYDDDLAVLAALPRARAHLALHDTSSAHRCVLAILATPGMLVSRYSLAEAMLYDAQIAQLNDDPGRAFEMTWGAIELAQDDIVLPFLAVYGTFAPLLARHPALAARWPRPPHSGPVDVSFPAPQQAAQLLDPLTQREQAVLRFLATSLSPAEIADQMCLSVHTVKTHLAAIYRKLSASKRREAVARARELELL